MDGSIPRLDQLYRLKKQYYFTLYCDEAHSFLSIGQKGRGCLEFWNEGTSRRTPAPLIDRHTDCHALKSHRWHRQSLFAAKRNLSMPFENVWSSCMPKARNHYLALQLYKRCGSSANQPALLVIYSGYETWRGFVATSWRDLAFMSTVMP